MQLDLKNSRLEISRTKFSELKIYTDQVRHRKNAFRTMLREGRLVALLFAIVRRSVANLESAIRLQGGLRGTLQRSLSEVRRTGLKGFLAKIHRRLGEQTEFDPVSDSPADAGRSDERTPFHFKPKSDYEALYQAYLNNRADHRNIAIFRAITGGYDEILPYEHYVAEADYFTFTDDPANIHGLNLPVPYYDVSPTRRARFIKLHPHMLFPNHDVAVWHDGNVMIRDDIGPLIRSVLSSNLPIGTFLHPSRSDIFDEARACIEQNKDRSETILSQFKRYSAEGFLSDDLVESNFVVYNLKHPALKPVLTRWWAELDRGSYRDQLSFNYAIETAETTFLPLAQRPTCVRNHAAFAFFASHGYRNRPRAAETSNEAARSEFSQHTRAATPKEEAKADVLVCVHNALEDVKDCLESVVKNRQNAVEKIIVVDDGSNDEARLWLENFASSRDDVILHRNDKANGYTKAANKAISLSDSANLLLLNSDAIVGSQAIPKMLACMHSLPGCGIVGPLSNAASYQSIPGHLSAAGQTAVNALPPGYSADDVDTWCAENARGLPAPGVPFVHGFCMCVKREVFDRVGGFDEASFPYGYGEENDFCIRASEAGFRLNIAIDAFVFHAKSKSYSNDERRKSLMAAGDAKLRDLHGTERVSRLVQSMQNNPTLAKMRNRALKLYH